MNDTTIDSNTAGTGTTTDTTGNDAAYSYNFADYIATAAPTVTADHRLSKCQYRGDNAEKLTSSYIQVPVFTDAEIEEQMPVLMPHLVSYLEDKQDSLVKVAHKAGFSGVDSSTIDLAAVIDLLEATGQGRLNKELIFKWFDADMSDSLTVAFADKLGISENPTAEDEARVAGVIASYRVKFGALAGGKSTFVPEEAERLQRALEVTEAISTVLGARFNTRLEAMKKPADLLESL